MKCAQKQILMSTMIFPSVKHHLIDQAGQVGSLVKTLCMTITKQTAAAGYQSNVWTQVMG